MATTKGRWITPFLILTLFVSVSSAYTFVKLQTIEKTLETQLQNAKAVGAANNPAPEEPARNLDAIPAVTDQDWIVGSKDAEIVMVEYSDLECPFCKKFHSTMQQIVKDYGGKVAWVFRHYPLDFHEMAGPEAQAAECVAEQGGNDKFWKFIDTIYERTKANGKSFDMAELSKIAKEVGVDGNKMKTCVDSGKYKEKIGNGAGAALGAGINGTPGTVIFAKNGKKDFVAGAFPISEVKSKIDALLK